MERLVPRPQLLPILLALCACGETGDLVLAEDWSLVPPSEDPVPGRPADAAACPSRAITIEAGALEADTAICGWITAEASARFRVRKGRELDLFVFHRALTAPEPAEAIMGINLGQPSGEAQDWTWGEAVPVPSRDDFYKEILVVEETIEEGDPLIFHVHNHGANTYTLGHLRAL